MTRTNASQTTGLLALINGRLILPHTIATDKALVIAKDKIEAVVEAASLDENACW